jgi:phosphoglycolate phosphatase-like HAD superfamily hydrolase
VRPTVLLWDIDGTLIHGAGAGRRAIERAFERRFGRSDVLAFPFDGMTDPIILRQGLAGLGMGDAEIERAIGPTLRDYLAVLAEICADVRTFRVHAGIQAALALVTGRDGFAVGLGTGNVEEGARLKLAPVGLNDHFSFGGYGSDHGDRPQLISIGADRGAQRLGVPRAACRVVVIGDTPKDIAAARANGAESIAVATGSYQCEALLAAGATYAFADLTDPKATVALLEDRGM